LRGLAAIAGLLIALAAAPPAWAHASLVRAEPADGAMVAESPAVLTLTFNEPVSPLVMRLIGPGGEVVAPAVAAENAVVTITPPPLLRGTHVLSWRVTSADGHPVGGALVFSVGEPTQAAPQSQGGGDPLVRTALWTAKLVIYVGLFIGVGGAFFQAWLGDRGLRAAIPTLMTLMVMGLMATLLSVGLQGLDALDLPLTGLMHAAAWQAGFGTSYGSTAIAAALASLAGLLTFTAGSVPMARGLALAGLLGVGLALSLSGHASTAAPQLLTRPSVFLHGVCVAFWIGALIPLAAAVRGMDRGIGPLAQFTATIPYPLALLVLTGAVLVIVQLDHPAALWTTSYGIILSCKLAAIAVLLALAALNRFVLTPRLAAADRAAARPLAISIIFEVAIALAILALVAGWRFTPPPRSLAAAATAPVSIHVHGERAMAQIEITPRHGHGADLRLLVLDGELRPLAVKEVMLILSNAAAGIEPMRRAAIRDGENTWHIDDLRIPVAGRWRLRLEFLISDFEKVAVEDDVALPRSP